MYLQTNKRTTPNRKENRKNLYFFLYFFYSFGYKAQKQINVFSLHAHSNKKQQEIKRGDLLSFLKTYHSISFFFLTILLFLFVSSFTKKKKKKKKKRIKGKVSPEPLVYCRSFFSVKAQIQRRWRPPSFDSLRLKVL
ncbi:hypothetical protein V6Z11_A04G028900 [Gossypium hirsutum]